MISTRTHEDGFTIIEAIVAASILLVLFAGFGRSMGTAFQGSHDNDVAQEATAIAVDQLEFARSLSWDELAMTSVATGAPAVDAQQQRMIAAEADLQEDEALVVDAEEGRIAPMDVETVDGQSYTVWRAVSAADGGFRRVIVTVEWHVNGVVSYYRTSTLISEAATR